MGCAFRPGSFCCWYSRSQRCADPDGCAAYAKSQEISHSRDLRRSVRSKKSSVHSGEAWIDTSWVRIEELLATAEGMTSPSGLQPGAHHQTFRKRSLLRLAGFQSNRPGRQAVIQDNSSLLLKAPELMGLADRRGFVRPAPVKPIRAFGVVSCRSPLIAQA